MSDATPAKAAPAKATPAKAKKDAKPKKPADHPKYIDMVKQAIGALKERSGSSKQAIVKYIMANFNVGKDTDSVNRFVKVALKSGVAKGALKQPKGTGASGSFRLGEADKVKKPKAAKKPAAAKPKAKKPKSPKKKAAAKPKKSPAKKKAAAKPKKSPTKKKAAAKPKKSPAKKAAKKTKSPKKAAKK